MVWQLALPLPSGPVDVETHVGLHHEEGVAAALFFDAPDSFIAEYCPPGRIVELGTGGGPFDEHPRGDQKRKEGHCTATLVAEAAGLAKDPRWGPTLSYTLYSDRGVPRNREDRQPEEFPHPFDPNNLTKMRWRWLRERMPDGIDRETVSRVVTEMIRDIYSFVDRQAVPEQGEQRVFQFPLTHLKGETITFVTSTWPSLGEVMAMLAIIEKANFDFYREHCPGGRFDLTTPREGFASVLHFVARQLNLLSSFRWRRLVLFGLYTVVGKPHGRKSKRKGKNPDRSVEVRRPFDLGHMLEARWGTCAAEESDARSVIEKTFDDLRCFLWVQDVMGAARRIIEKHGRVLQIAGPDGHPVVVVIVDGVRNFLINAAARRFFKADLVIMRGPTGNVNIFSRRRRWITRGIMGDIAQSLNILDLERSGQFVPDSSVLRQEGRWEHGGVWYYSPEHGQLHNGTESYPDVPPTRVSLEEIEFFVRAAFDPAYFPNDFAEHCAQGVCISEGTHHCPLHRFWFRRCRSIRYDSRHAKSPRTLE